MKVVMSGMRRRVVEMLSWALCLEWDMMRLDLHVDGNCRWWHEAMGRYDQRRDRYASAEKIRGVEYCSTEQKK